VRRSRAWIRSWDRIDQGAPVSTWAKTFVPRWPMFTRTKIFAVGSTPPSRRSLNREYPQQNSASARWSTGSVDPHGQRMGRRGRGVQDREELLERRSLRNQLAEKEGHPLARVVLRMLVKPAVIQVAFDVENRALPHHGWREDELPVGKARIG